ncbi:MAG: DUF547 domain-containing protein [Myxococcota bacterium]
MGQFDDSRYAELLTRFTRAGTIGGVSVTAVDYAALAKQKDDAKSLYRRVLRDFDAFNPAALPGDAARKAFWMNAYNIGAIKMILDHWPVDSITSRKISILGSPWKKKIIRIGGEEYSLDRIEHGILLGDMRELRTHWGIVCASVSCPNLRREPFRAERIDAQLAEQGKAFWSDPEKGARIDREAGVLHVTKIYKFDQKNFDTLGGGIGKVVAAHLDDPEDRAWIEKGAWDLEIFGYDWSVNDTARLDR